MNLIFYVISSYIFFKVFSNLSYLFKLPKPKLKSNFEISIYIKSTYLKFIKKVHGLGVEGYICCIFKIQTIINEKVQNSGLLTVKSRYFVGR